MWQTKKIDVYNISKSFGSFSFLKDQSFGSLTPHLSIMGGAVFKMLGAIVPTEN